MQPKHATSPVSSPTASMHQDCFIEIRASPITADDVLGRTCDPAVGAQSLFLGVVRDHNAGRKVCGITYDAYQPMAESALRAICDEATARWGCLKIAVVHRVGQLAVGDVSVAIAVGAPHRQEACEASRYIIEELKKRVTIWKKEHYVDGDSEWLQGHALCGHRSA